MKNILFVIDSLTCGGAEKSLVSLLNNLDYSKYNVDLLLMKRGGEFENFLSREVNILESPKYFRYLSGDKKIDIKNKVIYIKHRLITSIRLRINNNRKHSIDSEQIVYESIKNILEPINKKYDVAIAYSQGLPTYFVSEIVNADKKLSWINCDYVKAKYDKELDNKYYNNINKIIVVSDFIYNSISKMKYDYKSKLKIILDIVDPKLINSMAIDNRAMELENVDEFKILTVGRLAYVKGYDLAVKVAILLKESNYKFKWFIIGEGPERNYIEKLIKENNLENEVILLGVKSNPYPYMKKCDLYVQPSRTEGFGLTVVEAKILGNVIVSTNFDTANKLINNNIDGIITEKNENSIYINIKNLIDNKKYYNRIKDNVISLKPYNSTGEIEKFYEEIY